MYCFVHDIWKVKTYIVTWWVGKEGQRNLLFFKFPSRTFCFCFLFLAPPFLVFLLGGLWRHGPKGTRWERAEAPMKDVGQCYPKRRGHKGVPRLDKSAAQRPGRLLSSLGFSSCRQRYWNAPVLENAPVFANRKYNVRFGPDLWRLGLYLAKFPKIRNL